MNEVTWQAYLDELEKLGKEKVASAKWKALVSSGRLGQGALGRLRKAGLMGPKHTEKYIQGLKRGNKALMKRHNITPGYGMAEGFQAQPTLRQISGGHTYKGGKNLATTRLGRMADPAMRLRHEINEVVAGRKGHGMRKGLYTKLKPGSPRWAQQENFMRRFGHYNPSVIQRESRHLRFMPPETQGRFAAMRNLTKETDFYSRAGGYPNLWSPSGGERKRTQKKLLERAKSWKRPSSGSYPVEGGSLNPSSPTYAMKTRV